VLDRLLEGIPCNLCESIDSHILQLAQYDVESLRGGDWK
jgi:hypothetical protein